MNTKLAIREKLLSVEERVGIINIAINQPTGQTNNVEDYKSSMTNTFLLSRIASTISTISAKAYQSTLVETVDQSTSTATIPTIYIDGGGDSMTKFKRLGQYLIQITVTCAVLVKRSPLPGMKGEKEKNITAYSLFIIDLLSFLFGYLFQLMIWVDSEYRVMQRAQAMSIQCLKFGLQANEQYRLHEFVSEGLYMVFAAGLKATVAFNETPAYDPKESVHHTTTEPPKTTCLPTVSQKSKSPWVWSPW